MGTNNEKVSIIGVNSWGQALRLNIDWKPQSSNTSSIGVSFHFEDGKGGIYEMNEQNLVPYDKHKREYKAPGISLEVLNPFRRLRIKFRGYLTKSGSNEVVFVKMRLLWIAISNVFDFECDHNKDFIECDLKNNSKFKSMDEIKFENRFEQMGQMKGTFQVDHQNEEKLFLWGNKSKKYTEENNGRKISRLFGYSKKGWVFHIGSVVDPSQGINGFEGKAVFMSEDEDNYLDIENIDNNLYFPYANTTNELVLSLNDRKAENVLTSGGKGSSLASLNHLSAKLKNSIDIRIPKGIVVTCSAYKLFVKHNKQIDSCIQKLKSAVGKPDILQKECSNVVNAIKSSQLPVEIKNNIRSQLDILYANNDFNGQSFAVRSSAAGEDSEEMSAAGQMTTYLGVRGLDEIYDAVLKCWSSQFDFIAVEYKRGYGQDVDSMMAVVIQEMVDCDSAGVLFTCDPVSGDETEIIITGNYGIGESVVSAMSEPDTIRVALNITDNSFNSRTVKGIKSISIGSKAKAIKMNTSGSGTFFGSVRDIEWGIKDDQIVILQSRPVTNLDTVEKSHISSLKDMTSVGHTHQTRETVLTGYDSAVRYQTTDLCGDSTNHWEIRRPTDVCAVRHQNIARLYV
ncbi:unnamed protein product [Medioppia subpectinata]|uniref:Pyruvate phosphate dikinase AMP/ATP-binding domain-containing protein n=1 Tax=Medioppia subpectinata TaxID=1979941 RepID=A0A7R9KKE8_9ACAR|nr:unnamed protein product [Medioppia subpectinata]CAG2105187.1 unnamed protein product [Medioppia subpectinata]